METIAVSQEQRKSKSELISLVMEGRYTEAMPGLEFQFTRFPKDPDYLYYTGVCMVQTSYNIPKAIRILVEVSKQKTYTESWFYLARAYMMNYQFDEALEAFDRFNDKASRDEKEKVGYKMYSTMCRNVQSLCVKAKKLNVIRIDTIQENNFLAFLKKQTINGRFETVEEASLFSNKTKVGIRYSSENGDLVFQTKTSFGKKFKDIFYSEADDIEISKQKNLGYSINSSFDEDFVYYDASSSALYFSSQGHNSLGGYDIFRSYFDNKTNRWSAPENMGFPINTPFDEVAFITIPETNKALLVSKRNCGVGKLVVYILDNINKDLGEYVAIADAREISNLKPGWQKFVSSGRDNAVQKEVVSVKTTNEVPEELQKEQSYQRLIHEALNLQIRSDSLRRLSDEKKEMLITSKFESDKTKLWQEIKSIDTRADEIQQQADLLYRKAREVEAVKQNKKSTSTPNTSELAQKAFGKPPGSPELSKGNTVNSISYRIQIGVFSKPQNEGRFKGLAPVYTEKVNGGAAVKYYVGLYSKVADAERGLIKVKDAGFNDAYIIGFYNGKAISISRAREMEKSSQNQ